MTRFLIIAVAGVFASLPASTQPLSIEQLRYMYFESWQGQCGARELSGLLDGINANGDPVITAYHGAAISTTANCFVLPLGKWKTFKRGRDKIEEAVETAPENLEVRFLRFTVQSNIPSFLNYNNLAEDKGFILKALHLQSENGQHDLLTGWIIAFLLQSGQLGEDETRQVEELKKKIG
jgi:hypothetical protein